MELKEKGEDERTEADSKELNATKMELMIFDVRYTKI